MHVISLFCIIRSAEKRRSALLAWIIVAALWGGVLLIDQARHAFAISEKYS